MILLSISFHIVTFGNRQVQSLKETLDKERARHCNQLDHCRAVERGYRTMRSQLGVADQDIEAEIRPARKSPQPTPWLQSIYEARQVAEVQLSVIQETETALEKMRERECALQREVVDLEREQAKKVDRHDA